MLEYECMDLLPEEHLWIVVSFPIHPKGFQKGSGLGFVFEDSLVNNFFMDFTFIGTPDSTKNV